MVTCSICVALEVLGVLALVYVLSKFYGVFHQLIRPAKDLSKYGDWAVVTGATSGIGESIAHELAKKGQNLLLIGRSIDKLRRVQSAIGQKYTVNIELLEIDLVKFDKKAQNLYDKAISGKNIGILVNNAGLSYPYVQYFDEVDQNTIDGIIAVNSSVPTILIKHTLPIFLKKNAGAVINISSAGSIVPHELHAVYAASKAYLNKLNDDLRLEYESKGISFQVQLPYFVVSNMSKIKKSSLTVPTSDSYAYYAVKNIGYSGQISPHPIHALIFFVLNFVPSYFLEKYIGKLHQTIRKKAMKKYESSKAQ